MIINVLSKKLFNNLMYDNKITDDNVETYKDVFFISINDTKSSLYYDESWFKKAHPNVLVLYFDDVENENETSPTNSGKCTPFSYDMAKDLLEFIERNLNRSQCIVHCLAGISRSSAVGLFISDLVGNSYETFMRDNPQSCPNARVLRLLNRVKREDISSKLE